MDPLGIKQPVFHGTYPAVSFFAWLQMANSQFHTSPRPNEIVWVTQGGPLLKDLLDFVTKKTVEVEVTHVGS